MTKKNILKSLLVFGFMLGALGGSQRGHAVTGLNGGYFNLVYVCRVAQAPQSATIFLYSGPNCTGSYIYSGKLYTEESAPSDVPDGQTYSEMGLNRVVQSLLDNARMGLRVSLSIDSGLSQNIFGITLYAN